MLDGFTPWPEAFASRYRKKGYWNGEIIDDLIVNAARTLPDSCAIIDGNRKLTYEELDCQVNLAASALVHEGIRIGDTVVVHLRNSIEFVRVFFGLQRIGAIPVLALPSHREAEISHFCKVSGAISYIQHASQEDDCWDISKELLQDHPHLKILYAEKLLKETKVSSFKKPEPSDVAVLLVSGGTTGLPKLIPRTHNDYLYNARASAELVRITREDVYLVSLPAAHNFSLACPGILGAFSKAATVVMSSSASPDEAFNLIQSHHVTVTSLVPAVARLWAEATEWSDEDLSSLRLLQIGGARLLPEDARMIRQSFGRIIQQVFGMAEGLLNLTELDAPDEIIDLTQGKPISPDDEIRIVDDRDREVPDGKVGQLITRGPYTLRGYFRADEYNASSFTSDGFYRTGDLVRRTADGYLIVEGRIKDQVNRGGEKISSTEIEMALTEHPLIADAAVVAIPDDSLGERSRAFVIVTDKCAEMDRGIVRDFFMRRGIAEYKVPDDVIVLKSFPVTAVGKTDKRALARLSAGKGLS